MRHVLHSGPGPEEDQSGLTCPVPGVEAAACLRIALANGGIRAMRELIEISAYDRALLRFYAQIGLMEPYLAERSIEYRKAVLAAFDALVERRAKKAARKPESRSRICPKEGEVI